MSSGDELKLVDCTNEVEMQALGATLLQRTKLSTGVDLLHYHHRSTELPENSSPQHLILINTSVPPGTYIEQTSEGRLTATEMSLEDIFISPAHMIAKARWNQAHSYLALCLDPKQLEQNELSATHSIELLPQLALKDALLYHTGMALKTELDHPGFAGQLYLDSLLTAFTTHLLRHYCVQKPRPIEARGLNRHQLREVLDYIQSNLGANLTLVELAAIAQVSPNYFATQFKRSLGVAPHQYVIQQRIESAKTLLIARKESISKIADAVGFADQSHFTRHFKRLVGITPKQFLAKQ